MNRNLQRLLTDFGREERSAPQAGSTFGSRMAARGGEFGRGMMTGVGQAMGATGLPFLKNVDMRPASEKLRERLATIDRSTPEGQAELIQIITATKGADAGVALQEKFAKEAQAKLDRDAATARDKRDAALRQAREDRQVSEGEYRRTRDAAQDEINATQRVIDNDRRLGESARAERSLKVREESLALRESQNEDKISKEKKEQASNAALRKLYIRQAKDNNNKELAQALQEEAFPLEKAASLLYGSSRAQMTAPSEDEAAAMEAIIMSPAMELDIAGLPRKVWGDNLKPDIKRAIFYKAKELRLRDTKLSIEDALRNATISVKTLQKIPLNTPEEITPKDPQADLEI